MKDLKTQLIKLGNQNPGLRGNIRRVLRAGFTPLSLSTALEQARQKYLRDVVEKIVAEFVRGTRMPMDHKSGDLFASSREGYGITLYMRGQAIQVFVYNGDKKETLSFREDTPSGDIVAKAVETLTSFLP